MLGKPNGRFIGAAALLLSATPAQAQADNGMERFIPAGLKLNYGTVTRSSGRCPLIVVTTNSWKTETTTFTIDWAKITSVNYRPIDLRRVDVGGVYTAKSDKGGSERQGNGFVFDVREPAAAKALLTVLRGIRDGCGAKAGADEVG